MLEVAGLNTSRMNMPESESEVRALMQQIIEIAFAVLLIGGCAATTNPTLVAA